MSSAMKHRMRTAVSPLSAGWTCGRGGRVRCLCVLWIQLATFACLTACSGCTSVISSAYLREAWLDAVEHAADSKSEARAKHTVEGGDVADEDDSRDDAGTMKADVVIADTASAEGDEGAVGVWSPATLDEAVREAADRLASSGGLTAAARGTLISMLQTTPREDWAVVVDEFTAALAAAHAAAPAASAVTRAVTADPPPPPVITPDPPTPSRSAQTPKEPEAARVDPPQRVLAIQNVCFASRVRAWGVVDRFETAEFEPGQEVIVYFELDELTSHESVDGHTTRIDTVLALVDGDGRRVHEWTFEPLEETCRSHRRDYFARYLVSMPESTPHGSCRLDIAVTDTISGCTARASLPVHIVTR